MLLTRKPTVKPVASDAAILPRSKGLIQLLAEALLQEQAENNGRRMVQEGKACRRSHYLIIKKLCVFIKHHK